MKQLVIGLLFITHIGLLYSQEVQILEPKLSFELDFSKESIARFLSDQAFEDCSNLFDKIEKEGRSGTNDYTIEEQKILFYCDETKDEIWNVEGSGCSWYCGGGPKSVKASSFLSTQGENSYEPQNAHDLNYKTAWVEGVKGYGIGEYLLYSFEAASPRINEIKILNGYIKSKTAWVNNSRVKTLKMYVNDQPYAILNLKDFYGEQVFSVKPIGSSDRKNLELLKSKPDLTLIFEILEVYKGLKYDDVAITEIYFGGLDVHCFAKGTKIQIDNISTKSIEDLKIGDSILTFDFISKKTISAKIEKLDSVIHHELVSYLFKSGLKITATQDHPFLIVNKGWSSMNPIQSKQYKGFEKINKIEIGDHFQTSINNDRLTFDELLNVEFLNETQITYTISKLSNGNNFIANGFIVGVEEDSEKTVGNPQYK